MKKQKTFLTEAEILTKIDRQKELLVTSLKSAEDFDAEAKRNFDEINKVRTKPLQGHETQHLKETALECKSKAKKLQRKSFLIEESKLPKLKRTLAAFKTQLMPFETNESVVLQK